MYIKYRNMISFIKQGLHMQPFSFFRINYIKRSILQMAMKVCVFEQLFDLN